jgi:hypothetical protein
MFVDSLMEYTISSNQENLANKSTKILEYGRISYKHVSLWCLLCDPHQTTRQLHIGVQLRKVTK